MAHTFRTCASCGNRCEWIFTGPTTKDAGRAGAPGQGGERGQLGVVRVAAPGDCAVQALWRGAIAAGAASGGGGGSQGDAHPAMRCVSITLCKSQWLSRAYCTPARIALA